MRKMKTKYAIYAILGSIFEKRSGVFFLYVITFFFPKKHYSMVDLNHKNLIDNRISAPGTQ